MTNAFDTAIGVLFGDPHMAVSGTYQAGGLIDAVPVRLIISQPDARVDWNDVGYVVGTTLIDVRVSECPAPAEGDVFSFGGASYVMQGQPQADVLRQVWTIQAVPQ